MSPSRREAALYEGIRLVRPLHRHVFRLVENGLAEEGITVAMRAVLEQLHAGGAQTVPQVARALALRRQFIQRLADELRARALVARAVNPAHRRSVLLQLTTEGEATMRRVLAREGALLREIAAPLRAADVDAFRDVMAYLAATFARLAPLDPEADASPADADAAAPSPAPPPTSRRRR